MKNKDFISGEHRLGHVLLKLAERIRGRDYYRTGRTASDMEILYPGHRGRLMIREFCAQRLEKQFMICMTAGLLAVASIFTAGHTLTRGSFLPRDDYGGIEREYTLTAKGTGNEYKNVKVRVSPRQYDHDEASKLTDKVLSELEDLILGENESLDKVRSPLKLITSAENGTVDIRWDSDNYGVIDDKGMPGDEIADKGEEVKLTARVSCNDVSAEKQITVKVLPPIISDEKAWYQEIDRALQIADESTSCKNMMELPQSINGQTVSWKEPDSKNGILIVILGLIAALSVYPAEEGRLRRMLDKRRQELEEDYPEILDKLMLLMGAGLTARSALTRISEDYRKFRGCTRYGYEELNICINDMNSGTAEMTAYEHWGSRCAGTSCHRLAVLLARNLRKGSRGLLALLATESEEAAGKRMSQVRRKGEEAGTKLLIPMVMMLGVVLMIVVVPAFRSMGV